MLAAISQLAGVDVGAARGLPGGVSGKRTLGRAVVEVRGDVHPRLHRTFFSKPLQASLISSHLSPLDPPHFELVVGGMRVSLRDCVDMHPHPLSISRAPQNEDRYILTTTEGKALEVRFLDLCDRDVWGHLLGFVVAELVCSRALSPGVSGRVSLAKLEEALATCTLLTAESSPAMSRAKLVHQARISLASIIRALRTDRLQASTVELRRLLDLCSNEPLLIGGVEVAFLKSLTNDRKFPSDWQAVDRQLRELELRDDLVAGPAEEEEAVAEDSASCRHDPLTQLGAQSVCASQCSPKQSFCSTPAPSAHTQHENVEVHNGVRTTSKKVVLKPSPAFKSVRVIGDAPGARGPAPRSENSGEMLEAVEQLLASADLEADPSSPCWGLLSSPSLDLVSIGECCAYSPLEVKNEASSSSPLLLATPVMGSVGRREAKEGVWYNSPCDNLKGPISFDLSLLSESPSPIGSSAGEMFNHCFSIHAQPANCSIDGEPRDKMQFSLLRAMLFVLLLLSPLLLSSSEFSQRLGKVHVSATQLSSPRPVQPLPIALMATPSVAPVGVGGALPTEGRQLSQTRGLRGILNSFRQRMRRLASGWLRSPTALVAKVCQWLR